MYLACLGDGLRLDSAASSFWLPPKMRVSSNQMCSPRRVTNMALCSRHISSATKTHNTREYATHGLWWENTNKQNEYSLYTRCVLTRFQ